MIDTAHQNNDQFLSLARKWRPHRMSDIVGQEYIVRSLQNSIAKQRVHHAYLFSGTRGVGKTTLARIMAMLMNCENAKAADGADGVEPCHECGTCRRILEGRATDVLELDAASHTQVDKMRELLESAAYAPACAAYKIFIIDEVHMLSKPSFNAMLKTLEEPPPHVKFILATTDPQKIPATIRSRCLCFSLLPLSVDQINDRLVYILEQEGVEFEPDAIRVIARLASGSMRDGLSILDQAINHRDGALTAADVRQMTGDTDSDLLKTTLTAIADGDADKIQTVSRHHQEHNLDYDHTLNRLANLLYKTAFRCAVSHAQFEDEAENAIVQEMAGRFSPNDLQVLYEIAIRGRSQLTFAPDLTTGFEMTLLRMMLFAPQSPHDVGDGGTSTSGGGGGSSSGGSEGSGGGGKPGASYPQTRVRPARPQPFSRPTPHNSSAGDEPPQPHDAASAVEEAAEADSDRVAETITVDAPSVPPPSAPPTPTTSPADIRSNDDWLRLAAGFGENAKALAYHCTFVGCEATNGVADKIILRLDKSRGSGLRFRDFLESEIRQRWGAGFAVDITQSQADEASGYYNGRAKQAALDTPFIKELMAEFPQARLIADSVKLTQQGDQQL